MRNKDWLRSLCHAQQIDNKIKNGGSTIPKSREATKSKMETSFFVCQLCSARSTSLSLWMSHLRLVHQCESNISLPCPVDECSAVYSKVNSLCSHIYRKHKDAAALSSCLGSSNMSAASPHEESNFIFDLSLPETVNHDVDQLLCRDADVQKKKSSLFLMQLKEERMLSQVAINDVVTGCKEVFQHTICHLRAGMSQKLSEAGIDSTDIGGFDRVFNEMTDPFLGLETAYLQDKFISQELGCIVSLTYAVR